MNIYVGNLAFDSTDDALKAHFEQFGEVSSAKIIQDRMTGKSRGFAFIEMPDENEAYTAISALHETRLDKNLIRVKTAQK